MRSGTTLIVEERLRQIHEEGWNAEHDGEHTKGELWKAATCYIINDPGHWPWNYMWWKPTKSRIRNLVKAGALIAAEIDRLQRLEDQASV